MNRKKQKNFYIYEDTINGIQEYADEHRMTASEVIEMLWETFQAGNSDKTDVIIQLIIVDLYFCFFNLSHQRQIYSVSVTLIFFWKSLV